MKKENFEMCRHIAQELELYASADSYKCPVCGEILEWESERYNNEDSTYTCPHCENTFADGELEAVGLYDYFEDVLDIEYRVGSDKQYRSVCIMVACGGPNIYIDTASKRVELYWWNEEAHYLLESNLCDEIDFIFEDMYSWL